MAKDDMPKKRGRKPRNVSIVSESSDNAGVNTPLESPHKRKGGSGHVRQPKQKKSRVVAMDRQELVTEILNGLDYSDYPPFHESNSSRFKNIHDRSHRLIKKMRDIYISTGCSLGIVIHWPREKGGDMPGKGGVMYCTDPHLRNLIGVTDQLAPLLTEITEASFICTESIKTEPQTLENVMAQRLYGNDVHDQDVHHHQQQQQYAHDEQQQHQQYHPANVVPIKLENNDFQQQQNFMADPNFLQALAENDTYPSNGNGSVINAEIHSNFSSHAFSCENQTNSVVTDFDNMLNCGQYPSEPIQPQLTLEKDNLQAQLANVTPPTDGFLSSAPFNPFGTNNNRPIHPNVYYSTINPNSIHVQPSIPYSVASQLQPQPQPLYGQQNHELYHNNNNNNNIINNNNNNGGLSFPPCNPSTQFYSDQYHQSAILWQQKMEQDTLRTVNPIIPHQNICGGYVNNNTQQNYPEEPSTIYQQSFNTVPSQPGETPLEFDLSELIDQSRMMDTQPSESDNVNNNNNNNLTNTNNLEQKQQPNKETADQQHNNAIIEEDSKNITNKDNNITVDSSNHEPTVLSESVSPIFSKTTLLTAVPEASSTTTTPPPPPSSTLKPSETHPTNLLSRGEVTERLPPCKELIDSVAPPPVSRPSIRHFEELGPQKTNTVTIINRNNHQINLARNGPKLLNVKTEPKDCPHARPSVSLLNRRRVNLK